MRISWVDAFLDLPADVHGRSTPFWAAVTDTRVSAARGEQGEFTSLLPASGDDHVRIQRVPDGWPRLHLDLSVDDPRAAAEEARGLGATVVADRGYVVLTSPAGVAFCLVGPRARTAAPAVRWGRGHTSSLDQLCLDVAPAAYDDEVAFWTALTGWRLVRMSSPEFVRLLPPDELPLQLLLQRLEDPDEGEGLARAHLDLGTSPGGRDREVERHVELGARILRRTGSWTVMLDPAGMAYCVTDHPPRHA